MDHYDKLVAKTLKEFESLGLGTCKKTNDVDLIETLSFDSGGNLFVTGVHHATEIFATYQSILQAISNGVKINAVPVVNVDGFNYILNAIKGLEEMAQRFEGTINDDFIRQILFGSGEGLYRDILYPPWSKWDYGGSYDDKSPLVAEIEKKVEDSSAVIDIHNCDMGSYIIITSHLEGHDTQLQYDIEEIIKTTIVRNGYEFLSGSNADNPLYRERREGVYQLVCSEPLLINFARLRGKANIVLEVPAYDKNGNFSFFKGGNSGIMATNVELLSEIAKYSGHKT